MPDEGEAVVAASRLLPQTEVATKQVERVCEFTVRPLASFRSDEVGLRLLPSPYSACSRRIGRAEAEAID